MKARLISGHSKSTYVVVSFWNDIHGDVFLTSFLSYSLHLDKHEFIYCLYLFYNENQTSYYYINNAKLMNKTVWNLCLSAS